MTSTEEIELLNFRTLAIPEIKHFISTRKGGCSSGEKGGLNLSFSVNDDPENVKQNRALLAEKMGIAVDKLFIPKQTHSSNIVEIFPDSEQDPENTDALITAHSGICIAVMSADCVPVLLYDRVQHVVAAIHAGWRGIIGGIIIQTIEKLKQQYHSKPENILAGIGPSICMKNYEVGEEVLEHFYTAFGDDKNVIQKKENNKGHLNLWEAARIQLSRSGLPDKNIEIFGKCTFSEKDLFFSARRSSDSGRFAAGIMLNL